MKVVTTTKEAGITALGTFDGLHLAHQQIIAEARRWAAELALPLSVLTFKEHPQKLWGNCPPLLMTLDEKIDFLAQLGVDNLLLLDFTPQIAALSDREFIALLEDFGGCGAVVGYNYTFGRGGAAGPSILADKAPFPVKVVPKVQVDGISVSSSRIREALAQGDVSLAAKLLGRPYSITGKVVHGAGRGRTLGIPTANIEPKKDILVPKAGVYIVKARGGTICTRFAVLNLGPCPTFEQFHQTLEVFLPNWQGDLYGQLLTVEFLRYLRAQRRFPTAGELQAQIKLDLAEMEKEKDRCSGSGATHFSQFSSC